MLGSRAMTPIIVPASMAPARMDPPARMGVPLFSFMDATMASAAAKRQPSTLVNGAFTMQKGHFRKGDLLVESFNRSGTIPCETMFM